MRPSSELSPRAADLHDAVFVEERSRHLRILVLALLGVASAAWLPWYVSALWFALAFALIGPASDWALRLIVRRYGASRPHAAMAATAAWAGAASAGYNLIWWMVWPVDAVAAALMGFVCICFTLFNGLNYLANVRPVLLAYVAPGLVGFCVISIVHADLPLLSWLMPLAIVQLVLLAYVFWSDRLLLLKKIATSETQRRHAEEANVAKSQFLATMTHELRTPLNAIIGFSEMLAENLQIDGKYGEADDAERINKAGRALLTLIDATLDLSSLQAGRLQLSLVDTDVDGLLADALTQAQPWAKTNGNELTLRSPMKLDPGYVDPARLRQCVLELVSNACKFTNNGTITVEVDETRRRYRRNLRIQVTDTGRGIAPEHVEKLFRPFGQVDGAFTREHDGAGVGLALTHRLINFMGGDVSVRSRLGVGSTFTLMLPIDREEAVEEGGVSGMMFAAERRYAGLAG